MVFWFPLPCSTSPLRMYSCLCFSLVYGTCRVYFSRKSGSLMNLCIMKNDTRLKAFPFFIARPVSLTQSLTLSYNWFRQNLLPRLPKISSSAKSTCMKFSWYDAFGFWELSIQISTHNNSLRILRQYLRSWYTKGSTLLNLLVLKLKVMIF